MCIATLKLVNAISGKHIRAALEQRIVGRLKTIKNTDINLLMTLVAHPLFRYSLLALTKP